MDSRIATKSSSSSLLTTTHERMVILNNLPPLPNDLLEQLAEFDKNDAVNFLKNLEKKAGEESTYSK